MKKKSEANSEFSRNKTIAQQRRSLPVYQVREELLQVRDGVTALFGAAGEDGSRVVYGKHRNPQPTCIRQISTFKHLTSAPHPPHDSPDHPREPRGYRGGGDRQRQDDADDAIPPRGGRADGWVSHHPRVTWAGHHSQVERAVHGHTQPNRPAPTNPNRPQPTPPNPQPTAGRLHLPGPHRLHPAAPRRRHVGGQARERGDGGGAGAGGRVRDPLRGRDGEIDWWFE
jgi:hypothetical protein